jgi:hypothetical protein
VGQYVPLYRQLRRRLTDKTLNTSRPNVMQLQLGVLQGLSKSTKINKMHQESRLVVVTKCHIQGLGLEWEGEKSPSTSPNNIERLLICSSPT